MVRILNTFCVALMGLSILALYHVSEQTRVAGVELARVNRQIAREHAAMSVLETEWERVAGPARIQALAAEPSRPHRHARGAALLLRSAAAPRRRSAPLNNTPIRQANAQVPATGTNAGSNNGL